MKAVTVIFNHVDGKKIMNVQIVHNVYICTYVHNVNCTFTSHVEFEFLLNELNGRKITD